MSYPNRSQGGEGGAVGWTVEKSHSIIYSMEKYQEDPDKYRQKLLRVGGIGGGGSVAAHTYY